MPHILTATILLAGLFLAGPSMAESGPEQVFAGKIMLSDKRFPSNSKSPTQTVAVIRKQSKATFQEDAQGHRWKIYYVAYFATPMSGTQYSMKAYDVSGGNRQLLATIEQYADAAGARSVRGEVALERKAVGANKNVQFEIQNGGRVIATARATLRGRSEAHKGKVGFKEEG